MLAAAEHTGYVRTIHHRQRLPLELAGRHVLGTHARFSQLQRNSTSHRDRIPADSLIFNSLGSWNTSGFTVSGIEASTHFPGQIQRRHERLRRLN